MENLKLLNETFFELYGRLFENKKLLTDRQYKEVASCLFYQYTVEYKKLFLKKNIDDKTLIFNLKRNAKLRIPAWFLFPWNRIARAIYNDIKKDFEKYYKGVVDGSNN